MNHHKDIAYMRMAYSLAEKARGWASPNPYVGAVVVNNDIIVGWGYHERTGRPHAEAIALERAGQRAHGATAYLTLEPCTHWGHTPPCIEKMLQAKLKRVVISDYDTNPIVHKKGIRKLRASGIEVSVGLLKEKNQKLNEAYIKYICNNVPYVTMKAAVSLDGKTATHTLSSQWISSEATREYIHLVRGENDAILAGIQTILKDNPRLTTRHPYWKGKKQTRIILDSHLRFPMQAQLLNTLDHGEIIIFTHKSIPEKKADFLRKKGARIIPMAASASGISLRSVLMWLGKHGISSVLIEGGGQVFTSFLEKKLADKILISVSPKLIGGVMAPSFFLGKGVTSVQEAVPLKSCSWFRIDNDIMMEGYV